MSEEGTDKQLTDSRLQLRGDSPILTAAEDRLGRARFAAQIATATTNWPEDRSLVIGLYGPWGSGKTSILNMVEESLRNATEKPGPEVLRFNPWEWSGQENLQRIFFTEIGAKLPLLLQEDPFQPVPLSDFPADAKPGWELLWMDVQRLCHALDRALDRTYSRSSRWFRGGKRKPPPVKQLWDDYASVIATSSALGSARDLAPWSGIGFAKAAVDVRKFHVERKLARLRERGQSTIHTARELLVNQLERRIRNLVVIIDDVDRLSPDQLVQMFQLVKANGDLPGVLYVMAFPREQVESVLRAKGFGETYIQKIVQIPLDIPKPRPELLFAEVADGIQSRLKRYPNDVVFDQVRWTRAWDLVFAHSFGTARAVVRYLDSLAFHLALLSHGDKLDVDPTDLAIVDAIRHFFPALHQAIGSRPDLFSIQHSTGLSPRADIIREVIRDATPAPLQERMEKLLMELLWVVQLALNESSPEMPDIGRYGAESPAKGRISNASSFNRYFELSLERGAIPSRVILDLLYTRADRRAFRDRLVSASGNSVEGLCVVLQGIRELAEDAQSNDILWLSDAQSNDILWLLDASDFAETLDYLQSQSHPGNRLRAITATRPLWYSKLKDPQPIQTALRVGASERIAPATLVWLYLEHQQRFTVHHRVPGSPPQVWPLAGDSDEIAKLVAAECASRQDNWLASVHRAPEVLAFAEQAGQREWARNQLARHLRHVVFALDAMLRDPAVHPDRRQAWIERLCDLYGPELWAATLDLARRVTEPESSSVIARFKDSFPSTRRTQ